MKLVANERGNALIVALLMLVVLTLLGIASTTTTTVELQFSGNDKLYKTAFYAADGGSEMGSELLEQCIDDRDWADNTDRGSVRVVNGNFYINQPPVDPIPSDANRDAFFPRTSTGSDPRTNIRAVGNPTLSTGSAIQLAAGYEGKGKGAAAGGAWIVYDVRAQHQNVRNTNVMVHLGWRHVL